MSSDGGSVFLGRRLTGRPPSHTKYVQFPTLSIAHVTNRNQLQTTPLVSHGTPVSFYECRGRQLTEFRQEYYLVHFEVGTEVSYVLWIFTWPSRDWESLISCSGISSFLLHYWVLLEIAILEIFDLLLS